MSALSRGKQRRVRLLYRRDGQMCQVCQQPLMNFESYLVVWEQISREQAAKRLNQPYDKMEIPDDFPTVDHVIEQWRGGSNHLANLRLTHGSCNNDRSNAPGNDHHNFVARPDVRPNAHARQPLTYSLYSRWPGSAP